jgi:hypothetical protein
MQPSGIFARRRGTTWIAVEQDPLISVMCGGRGCFRGARQSADNMLSKVIEVT